jgi:hypothetical protein
MTKPHTQFTKILLSVLSTAFLVYWDKYPFCIMLSSTNLS